MTLMARKMHDTDSEEEIREAFKVSYANVSSMHDFAHRTGRKQADTFCRCLTRTTTDIFPQPN